MNVNASTQMNPPRITLRLVKAGRFGAEDLIVRAYEARTKRA